MSNYEIRRRDVTERWRAAVLGYSLSSSRSIIKGSGTTSGGFTARGGSCPATRLDWRICGIAATEHSSQSDCRVLHFVFCSGEVTIQSAKTSGDKGSVLECSPDPLAGRPTRGSLSSLLRTLASSAFARFFSPKASTLSPSGGPITKS